MPIQDGTSIAVLLAELALQPERVVVELNLEIVERSAYAGRLLQAGDRIEIISFVGGG